MATPAGYAECSYSFTQAGLIRPAFITFGVDPSETAIDLIATAVQAAFTAAGSLNTVMDSSVQMVNTRVSLGTETAEDLVYNLPSAIAGGGGTTGSLPPNCAVLIRKVTARGGRRGRGRVYVPWAINETAVDEVGIIAGAAVTTLQNAANAWRAALVTQNVPMVVLHNPGLTATGAPDVVTSLRVDPLIATQRRRLGR